MIHSLFISFFLYACGNKSVDTADTATSTDDTATSTDDTATSTEVQYVTVGVYTKDDQGDYIDTGKTLFFEVGVECYSWTRSSQPHESIGNLEAVEEVHDHYNAGDNTSYVDGVFTWTEYGPEHTQENIDTTCAAGVDGVEKSVTAEAYYEDHGGLYLKIIAVE